MIKRIKAALGKFVSSVERSTAGSSDDLPFAVAILLVEIMHADHNLDKQEAEIIIKVLQQQFNIDHQSANNLFTRAQNEMQDAISLHQYTSYINSSLSQDEKRILMRNLWRVVFADGQIDKYEEHLIRRIAHLIHISHKDFIRTKHLVKEESA